jgi:hypothetical protein
MNEATFFAALKDEVAVSTDRCLVGFCPATADDPRAVAEVRPEERGPAGAWVSAMRIPPRARAPCPARVATRSTAKPAPPHCRACQQRSERPPLVPSESCSSLLMPTGAR